jgi:hypothetical protein
VPAPAHASCAPGWEQCRSMCADARRRFAIARDERIARLLSQLPPPPPLEGFGPVRSQSVCRFRRARFCTGAGQISRHCCCCHFTHAHTIARTHARTGAPGGTCVCRRMRVATAARRAHTGGSCDKRTHPHTHARTQIPAPAAAAAAPVAYSAPRGCPARRRTLPRWRPRPTAPRAHRRANRVALLLLRWRWRRRRRARFASAGAISAVTTGAGGGGGLVGVGAWEEHPLELTDRRRRGGLPRLGGNGARQWIGCGSCRGGRWRSRAPVASPTVLRGGSARRPCGGGAGGAVLVARRFA